MCAPSTAPSRRNTIRRKSFARIFCLLDHDRLTPQITGSKKQRDEGAVLFAVRVHLPC